MTAVTKNKPADRGGLRPGDILLSFGGAAINAPQDLSWRVATAAAGQEIALVVLRDGKRLRLHLRPEQRPARVTRPQEKAPLAQKSKAHSSGLSVADLGPASKRTGPGQQKGGVVVTAVGIHAAQGGFRVGDVIVAVDDQPITNKEQFNEIVASLARGQIFRCYLLRQNGALYLALPKQWE